MGKIKEIKIKVPTITSLPDGVYSGILGGYCIELTFQDKVYELTTDEGVRSIGYKVVVTIKDGVGTFETLKN